MTATWEGTITVPSGTVASDLTGFVVLVKLAHAPASFFTDVKADGGDIRVYESDGTTLVPHDVIRVDKTGAEGLLFFKGDITAASDSVFVITCGDAALSKLDVADANGRNAVWSDYHRVFVFDEDVDRTGAGTDIVRTSETAWDFYIASASPDLDAVGVAWDGTNYYTSGTNFLRKYDSAWTLVTSNTDPQGDSGIPTACKDLEVHDGLLYVPMAQNIAVFNASDLTYVTKYDISAQGVAPTSIAYNPATDLMYAIASAGGTTVWKYDHDNSFSYEGAFTLDTSLSVQTGITWWEGDAYINRDPPGNILHRVQSDGTVSAQIWGSSVTGGPRGLSHSDDGLIALTSLTTIQSARLLRPKAGNRVNWLSIDAGGGKSSASGLTRFTTWTMGITVSLDGDLGTSQGCAAYADSADIPNTHAGITHRDTGKLAIFNSTDSWLATTQPATVAGTEYRVVHTQATTANRKIYVNGVGTTDTTCAQRPSGTGTVILEVGRTSAKGMLNYAYVRNGELTATWLAAEDESWRTPESFYALDGASTTTTLTPDPAVLVLSAPAVTVAMSLTLTPDPAVLTLVAPSPTLAFGAIVLTPDPAALTLSAPPVAVSLGSLTLTPDPAVLTLAAPSVAVSLGGITLTPDPAVLTLSAPTVTLSLPLTLTPDPAVLALVAPAVTVDLLALTLHPSPAVLTLVAPSVSLLLTLHPDPAVLTLVAPTVIRVGGKTPRGSRRGQIATAGAVAGEIAQAGVRRGQIRYGA
jgi:hypothetical protein